MANTRGPSQAKRCGVRVRRNKLQIPSTKLQRSTKHQTSSTKPRAVIWSLGFGISLELGAWDLELPARLARAFRINARFDLVQARIVLADPLLDGADIGGVDGGRARLAIHQLRR